MRWIYIFSVTLLGLALGSCKSDNDFQSLDGTGFVLSLNDSFDGNSRAVPAELGAPLKEQFDLDIKPTGSEEIAYNGKFKETVLVKEGNYILVASYGDNPVVALDSPYYYGKVEDKEVTKGKLTSASISCSVANSLLSVVFNEESLKKVYDSYHVAVHVGDESVDITDASKSAYFRSGSSVKLVFHAKLAGTGNEVAYDIPDQKEFQNIAAAKHVKVQLGIDESGITSGVGISVEKLEVETVTIEETLPLEFLPKPKLSSDDFIGNKLAFAETEKKSAVIKLGMSSPLQDLKLKFTSADPKFEGLDSSKEYLLSNQEDKAAIETALGIKLPEVGVTEASLDFTSLIPELLTDNGSTVESKIEVNVKANNRWISEGEQNADSRTYTLTCNKPEFSVSVLPGNIWTKEFTVNSLLAEDVKTGNYDVLRKKMKYQFSTDGNSNWTDLGDDLSKADLTPGTTYYVRGVYRDAVIGKTVEVSTYGDMQIPNSTLDNGFDATYPKKDNPLYTFKEGWIGTRNPLTCHSNGANVFYVSKSSTLPINDNGSTVAHMMTIGWGAGNTCSFGNKSGSVINNISSGIVCVGDYTADGDKINPKNINVRPTGMNFIYKASPYGDDEYLVKIELINITDGVEQILGSGVLQSNTKVSNYKEEKIAVEYYDEFNNLRITHIRILFQAGIKEDRDHLEDKFRDAKIPYGSAYIIGSQFWLDSFSLVYDK